MAFKPGLSGNPSGRPKVIKEVQDLARSHCSSAMITLAEIAKNKKASPSARVSAAIALLDRGYGKPMQTVNTNVRRIDPNTITDSELAAIIAGVGGGDISEAPGDTSILH